MWNCKSYRITVTYWSERLERVIGDERDVTRWTRRRVHWSLFRRRWCETKWSSKNFCQIPKSSPISLLQLPTRFGTCSPRTGDGWSAQATGTRLHLAVTVTYKYNIVHTSTRLITRYAAFLAAGLQPEKNKIWTSCDLSLRMGTPGPGQRKQWRRHLHSCVAAKGGHFKHIRVFLAACKL